MNKNNFKESFSEFIKDMQKICDIFKKDIRDYKVHVYKLISYCIIVILLTYNEVFNFQQKIKVTEWLLFILLYGSSFVMSFMALKNEWSKHVAGFFKEFTSIIFTGLGILTIAIGWSMLKNFTKEKLILLGFTIFLLFFTKFYLALFEYFKNPKK